MPPLCTSAFLRPLSSGSACSQCARSCLESTGDGGDQARRRAHSKKELLRLLLLLHRRICSFSGNSRLPSLPRSPFPHRHQHFSNGRRCQTFAADGAPSTGGQVKRKRSRGKSEGSRKQQQQQSSLLQARNHSVCCAAFAAAVSPCFGCFFSRRRIISFLLSPSS